MKRAIHPYQTRAAAFCLVPGPGTWLLVEVDTGEIADEFDDEHLAHQTLSEQNDA
jgi:hypothetical protein